MDTTHPSRNSRGGITRPLFVAVATGCSRNLSVKGLQEAAGAKLLAGAATLFLVPTQQSYDGMVDITIECRGRQAGNWKCVESITQTQFLLADPNAALAKDIKASVAAFFSDVRATGLLGANCK